MNQSKLTSAVPAAVLRKLMLVRQRKMLVQALSALVAAAAVLLAAMGIAMLIDWLATLYDSRWRLVLTGLALLFAACTAIGWLFIAWRRASRLEQVAAEVDQHVPHLEERWTTMTRLGEDAEKAEVVHPAMLRRLSNEAASWEPRIEPENIVSLSTLARTMIGLTAVTAVLAVAVVLNTRETWILARRFWMPASSISATKLVDAPGNVVVARGEPLALNVAIDGTPVQNAILFVRPDAKPEQSITLVADRREPIAFSHRMRSVDEPFEYRFRAGDGQTDWYNVDVADRPVIEQIKLTITPPAYTKQKPKTFDRLPDRISALRNSRIELAVRPKATVESVQLKMDNDKREQLTSGADGWYCWNIALKESVSISPALTEEHGLTNLRSPKCQLIAYDDQPPVVKVLAPDDRTAVRPDDDMRIVFAATDDTGIGSAELVVYQENGTNQPTQIASIPIDLGKQQGSRSVQQAIDLNLKSLGAKDGTELSYEIRVREDRGDSEPRVASRPPANALANKGNKPDPKAQAMTKPQNGQSQTSPSTANSEASQPQATDAQNSQDAASNPANKQTAANGATPNQPKQSGSQPSGQQPPAKSDATTQASNNKPNANSEQPPNNAQNQTAAANPSAANQQPGAADNKPQLSTDQKPMTAENKPQPPADQKASPSGNSPQSPSNQNSALAQSSPQSSGGQQSPSAQSSPQSPGGQQPATANASPQSPTGQQPATANKPPQSPADQKAMTAKNSPKPENMPQTKNPAEPTAPREATSGRQSILASSEPKGDQQPQQPSQANNAQNPSSPTASNNPKGEQQPPQTSQANNSQSPNSPTQSSPSQNSPSPKDTASTMKKDQPQNPNSQANTGKPEMKKETNPEKATAGNNQNPSPNAQQTASNEPQPPSDPSTPSPGDNMTKRTLDVPSPQSAASQRRKIKIDQFAGSFEGQQRAKLEMAIEPKLEALDEKLAKAQRTSRGVLDGLEANSRWSAAYDSEITSAEKFVAEGKTIIERLVQESKDTPYAFVGLQLDDVGVAHVEPARNNFWTALQSKGDDRTTSVHDGWQHLGRARQLLADLRGQFERSKKEFQLAESVEKVKKMYQLYLENSQALLDIQDNDPTRYGRKMAQFELDEEYLKRLKEVMEMRNELRAELARILGEDPRLLRRFMDNLRARSNNLREQLADLTTKQEELNREVRAWNAVDEADRGRMAQLLLLRNVQEATKLATGAGELQDRYQSWSPLQKETKDASLAAVNKKIQEVATAASDLNSRAMNFIATAQQAAATPAPTTPAPAAPTAEVPAAEPNAVAKQAATANAQTLDQLITASDAVYQNLKQLEVSLRQIASRDDQPEISRFAANRLIDTNKLIADTSAWERQMQAHKQGSYTSAAEVTQYRLAMKTDGLAGKLADLEQQLAQQLQRTDNQLPEAMATKSRELLAALDKETSPNQLAAVYALHNNQLPRTTERQQVAETALKKAEKLYDELMKMAIAEMDKLPVQDPIAQLLEDPTLDELLAQLEREVSPSELLGIPDRPSNLRIVNDWMRPGNQGGASAWRRLVMNQNKQNAKQTQAKLNEAYKRALARALKDAKVNRTATLPKGSKLSNWNKLVSQLGNDLQQGRDKAPPEQYRRAIEGYFGEISRVVAEQDKQSP